MGYTLRQPTPVQRYGQVGKPTKAALYDYGNDFTIGGAPGSSTSVQKTGQTEYAAPRIAKASEEAQIGASPGGVRIDASTRQPVGAPQAPTSATPQSLYDFIQQGVANTGIGGKPVTIQQAFDTYNANLPATAKPTPISVAPVAVPQIGSAPQVQAGQVAAPPMIEAPQAQAAQVDLGDASQFQNALFHSIYDPVNRNLEQQLALQNRAAQGSLANNGLSGSGVEQAVIGQIRDENTRQRAAALQDASNQATVQRFGYEFQTKLTNAANEQQTRLANAGFTMQAQVTNAANVLQASIANAQMQTQASMANAQNATQTNIAQAQLAGQIGVQNAQISYNAQAANNQAALQQQATYFQLMGLTVQQGRDATNDFLQLIGMGLQDQQHLDNMDTQIWSTTLNTYLAQLAQIINAGTGAGSKGTQTSSNGVGSLLNGAGSLLAAL